MLFDRRDANVRYAILDRRMKNVGYGFNEGRN
jgi:hypothetical protein